MCWLVGFSWGVGFLSGGAQWTGQVIQASFSLRPSVAWVLVGWLAKPALWRAW